MNRFVKILSLKILSLVLILFGAALARAESNGMTRTYVPLNTSTAVWSSANGAQPSVLPADGSWQIWHLSRTYNTGDPGYLVNFNKAGTYVVTSNGIKRSVTVGAFPMPTSTTPTPPAQIQGNTNYQDLSWSGARFFSQLQQKSNVTFTRCTFTDSSFDAVSAVGWVYLDCKFIRTSITGITSATLFKGCEFGPGCFWSTSSSDSVALVDCKFDGSDRGPFVQTRPGMTVSNMLFLGTRLYNIDSNSGGSEWIGLEGSKGTAKNICIWRTRVRNCPGLMTIASLAVNDLVVHDLEGDMGGFTVYGNPVDGTMTGLVFENLSLIGGRVDLEPACLTSTWRTIQWMDPWPGRANNFGASGATFNTGLVQDPKQTAVFKGFGLGHTLRDARIRNSVMPLQTGFQIDTSSVFTY